MQKWTQVQETPSTSVRMDSCTFVKSSIPKLPARYQTLNTATEQAIFIYKLIIYKYRCVFLTACFHAFQNILLPECFFSFFDLRKEFKNKFPSEGELKDLNLQVMADRILKKDHDIILCVFCKT